MTAHYVYRCFDRDGLLAYVGSSRNVPMRLANHASGAWWAPTIVKVSAKVFPSPEAARTAERAAIKTEHPRWNVMSRWSSRCDWTEQQWRDYYRAVLMGGHATAARDRHIATILREFEVTFGFPITEAAA